MRQSDKGSLVEDFRLGSGITAIIGLSLEPAQALPSEYRDELEIVLCDICGPGDLLKIATRWEPARSLDAPLKQSLKYDLVDLLHNRRRRYDGFPMLTLDQAQQSPGDLRAKIQRLAPTKDLKRLLKAWDKHLTPIPTTRTGIVKRLLDLLDGAQPAERPRTASARRAA